MNNQIQDIVSKFLQTEKIPTATALQLASLGMSKYLGDIADIAYGVNYNQYLYNDERKAQVADYLGYILLNWQILAQTTGFSPDEISNRFTSTWLAKHNTTDRASIKDLFKHMKPAAKQEAAARQDTPQNAPANNFTQEFANDLKTTTKA